MKGEPPCRPWQVMQLDIKGPLPETPRGAKYVLCLIDTFSKWVETVPLYQIDAKTVAEAMVTSVVLRHRVPDDSLRPGQAI